MSISCFSSRWRCVVVVIFSVGTNGKFVIEPLPVTNRIRLQPEATCPAMPSRSLPGLFMK